MACTFLQFIFISPSSAESIKIKFYRSTDIIILMYHFENCIISPRKRLYVLVLPSNIRSHELSSPTTIATRYSMHHYELFNYDYRVRLK